MQQLTWDVIHIPLNLKPMPMEMSFAVDLSYCDWIIFNYIRALYIPITVHSLIIYTA